MHAIIHRGAKEIGGSCVELQAQGKSLLLDIGIPLANPDGSKFDEKRLKRPVEKLIADKLLPNLPGLYGDGPCDVVGIVITHSHLDHFGLGTFVRPDVPFYMTAGTQAMQEVSKVFLPSPAYIQNIVLIEKMWKDVAIGPFKVRAHPVDHSAPDAIALDVKADGKRVFYTGDLRAHGRIGKTFDNLVNRGPRHVDAMLMEGSSIGRGPEEYVYDSEDAVEEALIKLIKGKQNAAFLFCSSQNLARIVTAYRVALRTGRMLVIDLYIAYMLHKLRALSGNLPQYDADGVRVKFWPHYMRKLREADPEFYDQVMRCGHGIKEAEVIERRSEVLMLAKANSYHIGASGIITKLPAFQDAEVIWSMWSRYLEEDDRLPRFCSERGIELRKIHSSGHATVKDLGRLAQALQPKRLVPIHTFHPGEYGQFGVPVQQMKDGEVLTL